MLGLFIAPIIAFALAAMEHPLFPEPLDWDKINVYKDGEMIPVYSEQEFIRVFDGKPVSLVKGERIAEFDNPIDAAFWQFENQLTTNSHFGDRELKNLLKSKL